MPTIYPNQKIDSSPIQITYSYSTSFTGTRCVYIKFQEIFITCADLCNYYCSQDTDSSIIMKISLPLYQNIYLPRSYSSTFSHSFLGMCLFFLLFRAYTPPMLAKVEFRAMGLWKTIFLMAIRWAAFSAI